MKSNNLAARALVSVRCFVLFLCVFAAAALARPPVVKKLDLRSKDGTNIQLAYSIESFSPNEMGGTSRLVKALDVQVDSPNLSPRSSVRAVLINHCSSPWMDRPVSKTYIADLSSDQSDEQKGLVYRAVFQDFVGSATGYRYDTECHQEIAVVRDGTWLKDPLNGTSNFQFALISMGIDEDPLAKWADPTSHVELAQAGAWRSCEGGCQGLSALARVRSKGTSKKVGLVYSTVDAAGQLKWHEALGKYVAPLSLDAELWEIQLEVKDSRAKKLEFALFVEDQGKRNWDNNCGANYFAKLAEEKSEVDLIEGHKAPCN